MLGVTRDVVCCRPQASALEAIRLMCQKHVGGVVVVNDPENERMPVGVVTDRDLTGIVTLDDLLKTLLSDMQLLLEMETRAQRRGQTARH